MKIEFLNRLVCPECKCGLDLSVTEVSADQIRTGMLTCRVAGHQFPITRFVPRFVNADAYADSFSLQRLYVRRHFKHYLRDSSGDQLFLKTTGFSADDISTGMSLEIGCGYGRFADVINRMNGSVVGVDLSTHSIDLAQDYVGLRPNVHLVQADLFHLPFAAQSFDRVFSIGVLHHTPDTEGAFAAIVPYVKTDGQISIWVYHPAEKRDANAWRTITTRLNHRVLYGACVANQILFSWIRALPGGWHFNRIVPGASPGPGRQFWLRVLSDFDSLSPVYAHVHTPDDVRQWFQRAGLERIEVLPRRTAVTGRKPHVLATA
jgi:SAM-dependent methyltransferase